MKVIGISGKIGEGKDYVKDLMVRSLRAQGKHPLCLAFATSLKAQVAASTGIPLDSLNDRKNAESRRKLQEEGNKIRSEEGPTAFVRRLEAWASLLAMANGFDVLIIPDVRFPDELRWVQEDMGGKVLRLRAPKRNAAKMLQECGGDADQVKAVASHITECALDGSMDRFDLVIPNDPEDAEALEGEVAGFLASVFVSAVRQ